VKKFSVVAAFLMTSRLAWGRQVALDIHTEPICIDNDSAVQWRRTLCRPTLAFAVSAWPTLLAHTKIILEHFEEQ
jgi:hypothetical protein